MRTDIISGSRKAVLTAVAAATICATAAQAANHREAPITALDHKADITDFFAFVSYDNPEMATLILNVDPLLEPGNGPNYFPFDPELLYAIRVDNNHDAVEDLVIEVRFNTEIRAPGVFTSFVGAGAGLAAPENSAAPVPPGTPIIPPAITALDGPGSEGYSLRQNYTVRVLRNDGGGTLTTEFESDINADGGSLIAVPSNVGPRTMPDYADLSSQGIYELDNGMRIFAGTADDPFWIDLGAAFDSLNFRPSAFDTGVPGVLSDEQDAADGVNFAQDEVSGYNVNTIAVELPIAMLTATGERHAADEPEATIGTWGTTSRSRVRILSRTPGEPARSSGPMVQIQRMGNPLFNELIIGTGSKDAFSMSQPSGDEQFASFALDPVLARALNAIYTDALPVPDAPRTDLLPLVQYVPPIAAEGTPAGPIADLLRLNTGVPATPVEARSRLGLLGGDAAGFPNGRRVGDDVTDIAARAVVGVLTGDERFTGFPHNRIGDGVNVNDVPTPETFPYVGLAHSGRDSRHVDAGETGCDGECPVD